MPVAKKTASRTAPARATRTGRPVMLLLDLLGKRWAMRILWELREGRHSFRSLQAACDGISPAVLNTRLRELRDARLVELGEGEGYALAPLGKELLERFLPLVGWAERWARGLS